MTQQEFDALLAKAAETSEEINQESRELSNLIGNTPVYQKYVMLSASMVTLLGVKLGLDPAMFAAFYLGYRAGIEKSKGDKEALSVRELENLYKES